MITEQEAALYVRMTLKQWGLPPYFKWTNTRRTLGAYNIRDSRIELSRQILNSFPLFKEVFLHELAHALDITERVRFFGTYKVRGRNDFHGKNWKKWCLTLRIPARRFIPTR